MILFVHVSDGPLHSVCSWNAAVMSGRAGWWTIYIWLSHYLSVSWQQMDAE